MYRYLRCLPLPPVTCHCLPLPPDTYRQVFDTISTRPIASASIGQVYKATLKDKGTEVAVKVQRPGILAEIALDLYVLRLLTPIQTVLQNTINGVATAPEDIEVTVPSAEEWVGGGAIVASCCLLLPTAAYCCLL